MAWNRFSRRYRERLLSEYPVTEPLIRATDEALGTLPERYIEVVHHRFGFFGPSKTLAETGRQILNKKTGEKGVIPERARQIEAKALRMLRHPRRSRKIRESIVSKEYGFWQ